MNNYNEMIGKTISTANGDYLVIAHVSDDGCTDKSLNLYVGRTADGCCDLIAVDNALAWVVGDQHDVSANFVHFDLLSRRCDVVSVLDIVRNIDADLADWLSDRYQDYLYVR